MRVLVVEDDPALAKLAKQIFAHTATVLITPRRGKRFSL